MVKLAHKLGLGKTVGFLDQMRNEFLDPSTSSWRDIKKYIAGMKASPKQLNERLEALKRVDYVFLRGHALEELFHNVEAP
jgi:hypothetical protein